MYKEVGKAIRSVVIGVPKSNDARGSLPPGGVLGHDHRRRGRQPMAAVSTDLPHCYRRGRGKCDSVRFESIATEISNIWGIHLTGAAISPWSILPGAIETGRMPAFPGWHRSHRLGALFVHQILVASRIMSDSELQNPVKEQSAAA